MSLVELLTSAQSWLAWSGLVFSGITLIAFLVGWNAKFRLVGASIFSFLLAISCWTFVQSYTPSLVIDGALFVPTVYDNGYDLVVAQAPEDFPADAIEPSLIQLSENLKGGGRNGAMVNVRIRRIETLEEGVSTPIILGEAIRDTQRGITENITINERIDSFADQVKDTNTAKRVSSDEEIGLDQENELLTGTGYD